MVGSAGRESLKSEIRIIVRWKRKKCGLLCLGLHCGLPRLKAAVISSMKSASVPTIVKSLLLLFWL